MSALLYQGSDWNFDTMKRVYDAIEAIASGELGLSIYPNQIEVITSEQMLDAYSSIGMPLMYKHWSFGKHFARDEALYRRGMRGLAYEIVINSSPCISYIMEENTMTMQALVIAHAAFGHNHFFKNNELFKQWTDAEGILAYLEFAKNYIAMCEERYGEERVEQLLDAGHALMSHAVHRYPDRRKKTTLQNEERRQQERFQKWQEEYDVLWETLPKKQAVASELTDPEMQQRLLGLPEENILYFCEKNSPVLKLWEREILRIVRHIAQYFYPQKQTKVMNEGCASFVHYTIMNRLYEKGQINDGAMLEFLYSHSSVLFQPDFDDPHYAGINPYALGFAMMSDIKRVCENPTEEDREWLPSIAGNGKPWETLRSAWEGYRDESFILQYLSPAVIRKLKLFKVHNDFKQPDILIERIHNERGYRSVRSSLAKMHDIGRLDLNIQVVAADVQGDRKLHLLHEVTQGHLLEPTSAQEVLRHLARLWGYQVVLEERNSADGTVLQTHSASPPK